MLHGLLISEIKDYDLCIKELDKFLPYVDNWAVCDIMSPSIFKKNKDKLINKIKEWIKSKHTYTCRFGICSLMQHYLDNEFFATALAKQWDETILYIEERKLDKWVHNKTIQKSIESNRISKEQKEYLKSLKIKAL